MPSRPKRCKRRAIPGAACCASSNDILDWSKIEEGKLELAPQATSMRRLVAEVANTYSHVASGNSVTLTQQVDPRLSPALIVDPLRLSQVLNNFVSNAIKFSHGGRVELRAELLERARRRRAGPHSRSRTRVSASPRRCSSACSRTTARRVPIRRACTAAPGSGWRSAAVWPICWTDGSSVESAPGQGSTFSITLTLPIADAVAEPARAPRRGAAGAPGGHRADRR